MCIVVMQLSKDAKSVSPVPTPISTAPKVISNPALSYATVASFSWDQDNEKVKVRGRIKISVLVLHSG